MLRSSRFPGLLLLVCSFCSISLLAAEPDKSGPEKSGPAKSDKPEAHPASNDITPTTPGKYVEGKYIPPIAAASKEGENAIARIKVPEGFKLSLFAAEPMIANPVAFCFDERGRVFVCETFRQKANKGVEDNRKHPEWLNDDLAAQSVEDRLTYIKKHRPDQGAGYAFEQDRIRLLEDRDGDGVADHSNVYADGFRDILTGTGAGVLAHKGNVYYTCIPDLWKLRDTNNDGVADEREKLSTGYGVKFAFRGHDMHGLVIGPDGRLYWSIGDRGLNVTTKEGKHLYVPDTGAVLRSELDGSNTEIFCTGVRNPQELAFDDYGNLFTVDNNSDSGDKARLYHLVQGGDYGWRMYYQYLPDRGPWNREKLWGLAKDNLSQSVIPPIAHITDGPSGLVAYSGTGLPAEYNGSFFVCDFRGGPANSAVQRFTMEPDGASFKMTKYEPFIQKLLVTDCDFGPDGAFYVSDWVDGWDGLGKGRIYRMTNETLNSDPRVKEVQTLLKDGFDQRDVKELCKLLEHADRRVRMGAQFALVAKKAIPELLEVAKTSNVQLARLHAIWGVGNIVRLHPAVIKYETGGKASQEKDAFVNVADLVDVFPSLLKLTQDADAEVAGQAVQVMAQTAWGKRELNAEHVAKLLQSGNERLIALVASTDYFVNDRALYESLLTKYGEQSAILRWLLYRGFYATTGQARPLAVKWADLPLETRRAAAAFGLTWESAPLADADPRVVLNAAQRIYDATAEMPLRNHNPSNITPAPQLKPLLESLAGLISKPYAGSKDQYDALFRRILSANYRLGQPENAEALAAYAGRSDAPEKLRIEALDMLLNWAAPKPTDRVTNEWRPLEKRSADPAKTAITAHIGAIFSGPDKVRQKAAEAAGKLGIKDIQPQLLAMLGDATRPAPARAAAFTALGEVAKNELPKLLDQYQNDSAPAVRIAAAKLITKTKPKDAAAYLSKIANEGKDTEEQQNAIELLRSLQSAEADQALVELAEQLNAGKLKPELRLDVLQAVKERTTSSKGTGPRQTLIQKLQDYTKLPYGDAKLKPWREAMVGGDADRGEAIFYEKIAVSCVRCHKIDERGGDVGPVLSKIGKDKTRQYLLEAIVDPNRAVAQGFETVVIETNDGQVLSGIIKKETVDEITLVDANAKIFTVKTADVDSRQKGQSSMPEDVSKLLTPFEVRDLVEFLQSKK